MSEGEIDKAYQVALKVVDAIWQEALFMLTLTPIQSARYHKLRLSVHLKKYDELPESELKDFLSHWVLVLKEALSDRSKIEAWKKMIEDPEVLESFAQIQKEIERRLY